MNKIKRIVNEGSDDVTVKFGDGTSQVLPSRCSLDDVGKNVLNESELGSDVKVIRDLTEVR